MYWIDVIRVAHVLSACVLIGTGTGIAFFMAMAHRTKDPGFIARTAGVVVIADYLFTATTAIAQPITGTILAVELGWSLADGWLVASVGLYVLIGVFWLPVVFIQKHMQREAHTSDAPQSALSARYHRLFRIWLACGIPAFTAILVLLWLMVLRPGF